MENKSAIIRKLASYAPFPLVAVYAVVSALTLFMNGDDYIWYFIGKDESLANYVAPNGRYFSNSVTMLIVRYPVFRLVFIPATIIVFIYLIAKLIDIESKVNGTKLCFALAALILIPASTYSETVTWMSGFTNYIFSAVLTLIYLVFLFNVLFRNGEFKLYHLLLFPVLAFTAGLCVEHIAIYDVFLGIASVILLLIRRKKFYIAPVLYIAFAAFALSLMFMNRNYSNIAKSGDDIGIRTFYFSFSDFFYNTEVFVVPHYIKQLFLVNLIIAASFLIFYRYRRERFAKAKYAPLCMMIVIIYAAYSVFYTCFTDLIALKPDMKIRGFEFAFSFIYIVSLLYLIWTFFDGDKVIRLYFYITSTVMLTAPFMFINPVTARCFFENYVFWILFSGEMLFTALSYFRPELPAIVRSCFTVGTSALCVFILSVGASNKYYNDLRFDFVKSQIQDGSYTKIQIIDLPYENYVHDDLEDMTLTDGEYSKGISYYVLMAKYYGFDGRGVNFMHISTADYYLFANE